MYHYSTQPPAPAHLEWRPDVERLRTEIEQARRTGNLEHLAIAEAECWIDLIDAELSARRDTDDAEIEQLIRWRSEIAAMLKTDLAQARRS
jgi:hypothetical protein